MAAKYHKPADLKYTDLCIYIDNNIDKILVPNENPEIETRIYEYLYHILYALACKANFFNKFEDYESFSLYGAGELFISMRNKKLNEGKVVRGKEVVPIKSCLNFIKSVLFPLKVNYQRQTFATVYNPEIDQDTSIIDSDLRASIRRDYQNSLLDDLIDILKDIRKHIYKVLKNTPYRNDTLMVKRLCTSCQLTFLNDITIPNKLRQKLEKSDKVTDEDKIINLYKYNETEVILWHLPEHMADYVRILVTYIKNNVTKDLHETREATDLSDDVINDIMKTAYAQYDSDMGD